MVVLTGVTFKVQQAYNNFCRQNGIKFISCDVLGCWSYVFNDFGPEFEVVDKDGNDPVEVIIESITNEEHGLVTLIDKAKHPYEDGDLVVINNVEGMKLLKVNLFSQTKQFFFKYFFNLT